MKRTYVKPTLSAKEYAQLENVFTACNKEYLNTCAIVSDEYAKQFETNEEIRANLGDACSPGESGSIGDLD